MKKCQPRVLTPFLDGELKDELWEEINEHLQSCASCGTRLDELRMAAQQVRSMGRAEIPTSALEPALEIFVDRAGLPPISGLALEPGFKTLAAAAPASGARREEHDEGLHQAWSPSDKATPPDSPAPAPEAHAPTWVEPETWVPAEVSEPASVHPEAEAPASEAPAVDVEASGPAGNVMESKPSSLGEEWVGAPASTDDNARETADHLQAMEEHPSPPPAEIRPPWMAAAGASDDDLEELGRRAVDEASLAAETEETTEASPAAEPEVAIAASPAAEPEVATEAESAAPVTAGAAALEEGAPPATAKGIGALDVRVAGLAAAAAAIILAGTVFALTRTASHAPTTAHRTSSQASPRTAASPSLSAAPAAAPSPAATRTPTALTEVVTAGAGGGGWQVTRIRVGNPGPGIHRVVFDLEGSGPAPTAQVGRGSDGAIYVTAPGITISAAELAGFPGAGPITGISQTATGGLALRLATAGAPGFSITYLSVPNRLVLDFK